MMAKWKKVVSVMLAFAMTVGLLQSSALAVEMGQDETAALSVASEQQGEVAEIQLDGTWGYSEAFEVLKIVNQERKAEGLDALTMDENLMACAMQRAAECAVCVSHTRPDGGTCFEILDERDVPYTTAGENIAMGQSSASQVMESWMDSEGHRKNIMSSGYTTIGIGCFYQEDGALAWTQMFTDQTVSKASERGDSLGTAQIQVDTSLLGDATLNLSKTSISVGKTASAEMEIENGGWDAVSFRPNHDSVCFSSSKTSIAKVNNSGTVTAVASGTATITASLKGDSGVSASAKVTVKEASTKLSKPEISKAANTSSGIKITWKKVSGAEGYYVYRKSGSGDWKKAKTTTSTSWTDKEKTNGTKYQYKIYAYKGKTKSGASAVKTIYRLSTPKISSLKSADIKKLTVKWGKNSKASGYQIQYATDQKFTKNKDTVTVSKNSTVSKTISSLKGGKKYYVRVRSYKKSGDKKFYSSWSEAKSVKVKGSSSSSTVYITETGDKYHADGCRYLSKSKIPISLSEAKEQGYEPCSVCKPAA